MPTTWCPRAPGADSACQLQIRGYLPLNFLETGLADTRTITMSFPSIQCCSQCAMQRLIQLSTSCSLIWTASCVVSSIQIRTSVMSNIVSSTQRQWPVQSPASCPASSIPSSVLSHAQRPVSIQRPVQRAVEFSGVLSNVQLRYPQAVQHLVQIPASFATSSILGRMLCSVRRCL